MINILTVQELLDELNAIDDKDMPVEIAAYIFPSDIIKKYKHILERQKDDIEETGSECGIYCFQEEHVQVTGEVTASDVERQTGKKCCLTITGRISLEQLGEAE
jgi:hypothetical protein